MADHTTSTPVAAGPMPVYATKDHPEPTTSQSYSDPSSSDIEIVEAHEEEMPTESHQLAYADHEEKGAAQIDHGSPEVKNLGWNEPAHEIANPLVGGLPNEELYTLIRRFNKVRRKMSL